MTTLRDDISDDLCVCSIKPRQATTHIVGCPVPKALAFAERAAGEARLEELEQAERACEALYAKPIHCEEVGMCVAAIRALKAAVPTNTISGERK